MLQKTIPLFRIFDLANAAEFYIGWLGFRSDWQHRFEENAPVYWQISKDTLTLHLTEHHGDCCPGAKVFCRVRWTEGIPRRVDCQKLPL